jgi:hypothetical protein
MITCENRNFKSSSIQNLNNPGKAAAKADRGPWSPSMLAKRAEEDLATIAEAMHVRQLGPFDILAALIRQAALWRLLGAALPNGIALTVLCRLPGLNDYDPQEFFAERRRRDELEHQERRQRAVVLSDWLMEHAGSEDAEAIVIAAEKDLCKFLGGKG